MINVDREMDRSETIKNVEYNNNSLNVEYFDGQVEECNINDLDIEKLRSIMVEQAKQRQKLMNTYAYGFLTKAYLAASLTSFGLAASCSNDQVTAAVMLACGVLSFGAFIRYFKIHRELKKYDRFLEMYDDIDEVNKQIHDFYTPVLNIETLDQFEGYYINQLYKEYKNGKDSNKTLKRKL